MPATLPTPLPGVVGVGSSASTQLSSAPWDVVIGGYGFMLNNDPNTPFIRQGADYRSPYVNYTGAPGEQGIGFWWPRTQYAWQGGAGNPSFDSLGSGDASIALTRFYDSEGVDVFSTLSQFSLLKDTDSVVSVGANPTELVSLTDPSNGNILVWGDSTLLKQYNGTSVSTYQTYTAKSICTDGVAVYATDGSTVKKFTSTTSATLYTGLSGTKFTLRYAKQRLMLGIDNKLYELSTTASSAALPSVLFTHPNTAWIWTDICGGPGAIYACGYAGTAGAVYMFVLDTSTGALPVLSGGITACELPAGETPNAMRVYLDLFIGIGTSLGLRVNTFNADNSIVLAPLTTKNLGPVRCITTWDRFFYATCDNAGNNSVTGLVRVDLSTETDTNRYAYARDLQANSNPSGFTGVTGQSMCVEMLNGLPAFLVASQALFYQSPTRYITTGYLQTSKMYFGMTDYKIFERGSFTMSGQGQVTMSTKADSITNLTTRVTGNASTQNRVETALGNERGSFLSTRFDLQRASTTMAPIVLGYSLRALPSQAREDAYVIPLRCYDEVENRFGETVHQSAITLVTEIANLMRFQTPVIFQTFFGEPVDDWTTFLVQVETYEFKQVTAEDGWGGTLTLTLRTLTGE